MVDVTVVDWGTPELAARCVASLVSPVFQSIELVDAKSRGWSYATSVNRSLARGTAPYVLALNADTQMLTRDSAAQILDLFLANPDVAAIGPRQIDDAQLITHAGILGDNLNRLHRFWKHPLGGVAEACSEQLLDVPTISGSVYFCRRDVWERFGGFLETPLYYEETALDFKIRHAGLRVCYTGAVTWQHLWARSPVGHRGEMASMSRQMFVKHLTELGITAN